MPERFAVGDEDTDDWYDDAAAAVVATVAAVRAQIAKKLASSIPKRARGVFRQAWWDRAADKHAAPVFAAIAAQTVEQVIGPLNTTGLDTDTLIALEGMQVSDVLDLFNQRSGTIAQRVRDLHRQALAEDWDPDDLADALGIDGDSGVLSDASAENIGRSLATGLIAGAGFAALSWFADGRKATATKTWRTQRDSRVRDAHADADGQTVALDEPFDIGGEEAMYPGDPQLPPELAINCRCYLEYETDDGEDLDIDPDDVDFTAAFAFNPDQERDDKGRWSPSGDAATDLLERSQQALTGEQAAASAALRGDAHDDIQAAATQPAVLQGRDAFDALPDPDVTDRERQAVTEFLAGTGPGGAAAVNDALRQGENNPDAVSGDMGSRIASLDQATNQPIGEPIEVWAGVAGANPDDFPIGTRYTDHGFASASTDQQVAAASFTTDDSGVLLRYQLDQDDRAAGIKGDLDPYGKLDSASSLLLPRGQEYVVTGRSTETINGREVTVLDVGVYSANPNTHAVADLPSGGLIGGDADKALAGGQRELTGEQAAAVENLKGAGLDSIQAAAAARTYLSGDDAWSALSVPRLTSAQSDAVNRYTAMASPYGDYYTLNSALRQAKGDEPELSANDLKSVALLDRAIDKAPLAEPIQTWRGMSGAFTSSDFKVGQSFTDHAFVSTTTDPETAAVAFSQAAGKPVVLRVNLDPGEDALPIKGSSIGNNLGEDEVLLPRGQEYRITGKETKTVAGRKVTVVDVDMIGPAAVAASAAFAFNPDQERDDKGRWSPSGEAAADALGDSDLTGEQAGALSGLRGDSHDDIQQAATRAQRLAGDEAWESLPALQLPPHQQDAVTRYTAWEVANAGGHRTINSALREAQGGPLHTISPDVEQTISNLDYAIERSTVTEPLETWRGASALKPDEFTVGQTFTDYGFMSTTTDPEIALETFTRPTPDPMLLRVALDKGDSALPIKGDLRNPLVEEKEILLPRGQTFRVTGKSVEKIGDTTVSVVDLDRIDA